MREMLRRSSEATRVQRECADRPIVVLDIGGTTTRVARFDPVTQRPQDIRRAPTANYLTHVEFSVSTILELLRNDIEREVSAVLDGEMPGAAIIGYPGPVTDFGVALRSPTILGPNNEQPVDVAAMFSHIWPDATVHVLNDLTCAGYTFVRRGHRNFCVLTVGSGIGNKIFIDGRPHVGKEGFGGEIGHIKVSPKRGTPVADVIAELGSIASGRGTVWLARTWENRRPEDFRSTALANMHARDSDQVWSEQLVAAFRESDALAHAIVEAAARPLALAIAHLHLGCGLSRFFITGGFASALGESYQRMLIRMLKETVWDVGQDFDSMILVSADESEDGLSGACHLASEMYGVPSHGQLHFGQ